VTTLNVLFPSIGRRVELIRAFRHAYEEGGFSGSIIGLDVDPLAPALHEVDQAYLVPPTTDGDWVSTVRDISARHDVALIVPLVDRDIPVLAEHRRELEGTGARLILVPDEAVAITQDKLLTYRFFKNLAIPTPQSWLPEEAMDAISRFPVIVKPRFGSAGEGVVAVRNHRELEFFLSYVADGIVQEHLPGPEITSDVFSGLDGRVLSVVSRQRIEVRWGEVAKGKTIFDHEIARHCATIAEALGAIGPITVQCMVRGDKALFTEINPRFAGGAPLGIAAGVPSPRWLLELAAGQRVMAPPLGTYRKDLYLTRFDQSLVMTGEERCRVASHRL
jgi:carbamoyl-phosphate synthase large subunit